MEAYLQKRTKKGKIKYCQLEYIDNQVVIRNGDTDKDDKVITKKYKSPEEAKAKFQDYITKKEKESFSEPDFRIIDLFDLCFRESGEINTYVKFLRKLNVVDIRKLEMADTETQIKVLENNGLAIKYLPNASDQLKEIAINQNGGALQFIEHASTELKLKAIKSNCLAIKFIKNQTDEMKELAIQGKNIYFAFKYFEQPTRGMILAFLEKGISLREFEEYQNDKPLVLQALKWKIGNYDYISDTLKKDEEVALAALELDDSLIKQMDSSLLHSKSFAMKAAEYCYDLPYRMYHAKSELLKDKEFVLKAMDKNGTELQYVDESLQNDKDVVMTALQQNKYAIDFVSDALKKDKDVIEFLEK